MKVTEKDIDKIIDEANNRVDDYTYHPESVIYNIVEDITGENICKQIETITYQAGRWSIPVDIIFQVGDYYICGAYSKPATEMQEGQPTDIKFYQVYAKEVTTIEWVTEKQ